MFFGVSEILEFLMGWLLIAIKNSRISETVTETVSETNMFLSGT